MKKGKLSCALLYVDLFQPVQSPLGCWMNADLVFVRRGV